MWQGDHLLLKLPDRPVGVLKFRQVWGPLTTMRRYLDDRLRRLPLLAPEIDAIHPFERITTDEGEHAAVARVDLRCALDRGDAVKRPAVVLFGVVFGDNFMTSLDGLGLSPDHFDELHATVRDLTQRTVLMLGAPRRRRYVYRVPDGWQGIDRFWDTRFIPPGYPNVGAMITVYAAIPKPSSRFLVDAVLQGQMFRNATLTKGRGPEVVRFSDKLSGGRWEFVARQHDGSERVQVMIELYDSDYSYRLALDHATDDRSSAALSVFEAVCASVEPVPRAVDGKEVAATAAATGLSFWAE